MSQDVAREVPHINSEEEEEEVIEPGGLQPEEYFWRDHQKWLEERGYMLRSRYKPDWVPSWKSTGEKYFLCDDGMPLIFSQIIDAIRLSTGENVALKRVSKRIHPYEQEISQYFSADALAADPRNHCVPIYEVLQVPDDADQILLVMPLLRKFNDPPFVTVGEVVDFLTQLFEGLNFMHEHHVAHRDCMNLNVMIDPRPLYPNGFHPAFRQLTLDRHHLAKHYTRTVRPTKYYIIDFGISRKYGVGEDHPLEDPIWGGDKSVPEFQDSDEPRDPFPTDIYYIGNLIRESFSQNHYGLEFLTPLVEDMVQSDPSKRPTIAEVVDRFSKIRSSLGWWSLRSRLVRKDETISAKVFNAIAHAFRTVNYVVLRLPAIPSH